MSAAIYWHKQELHLICCNAWNRNRSVFTILELEQTRNSSYWICICIITYIYKYIFSFFSLILKHWRYGWRHQDALWSHLTYQVVGIVHDNLSDGGTSRICQVGVGMIDRQSTETCMMSGDREQNRHKSQRHLRQKQGFVAHEDDEAGDEGVLEQERH